MDKLLQSLLREWDYLLQLQDETLKALGIPPGLLGIHTFG